MIFMSYWFAAFAASFFILYFAVPYREIRKFFILMYGAAFQIHFAGPAGVIPIVVLGTATYLSGAFLHRGLIKLIIILCVISLIFYKYTIFIAAELLGVFSKELAENSIVYLKQTILPAAPPLAISFFVFEFVHYLADVLRGEPPIRSAKDFSLFVLFWPSIVAGPVKRYEQFIPSLERGCGKFLAEDVMTGMMRVASGLIKKFVADNMTLMIDFYNPQFDVVSVETRWLIFLGIGFRILLDFSGYSDIAIGFARMMGIKLPENFNFPYLARSPIDFWHRWHISLSTWIRDYIYIPLGGGRNGAYRKLLNGLLAFAVCGLWHGAGWNFLVWGLYHGTGIAVNNFWKDKKQCLTIDIGELFPVTYSIFSRILTFLFVMTGWLYFFFPVTKATHMLKLLIGL